ncbi:MAG: hypothetical protein H9W81_13650 [Enterococcus sp.]|nr:hypothetical protein [Enterococcus sp.]
MAVARAASDAKLEFSLYNGIEFKADLDDQNNPNGAFAAMAWFAKERIRVRQAPEGMMESLGLYPEPVEVTLEEDEELNEEEFKFQQTHLRTIIEGKEHWIPLTALRGSAQTPQVLLDTLQDLGITTTDTKLEQ